MKQDPAAHYATALHAIEEGATDPGVRAQLQAIATSFATDAGLQPDDDFVTTALMLKPAQQGQLLWQINKSLEDPHLRARIAESIAGKFRLLSNVPAAGPSEAARRFATDGVVSIPDLVSPAEAAEILSYLKGCTNLTREETVLHHEFRDVVRAPHAFRIAADERVLTVAHQHLGAPPTIVQMNAWWSLAESEQPIGAQVFHRDRDDFRACKLFIYLNDITSADGPHIVVRGSHRADSVAATLAAKGLPPKEIDTFFAGNGRQIATWIDQVFGSDVIELTGPAGTTFLENTYAFHRGKVPTNGSRYILQVLYGLIPYPARLKGWEGAALNAIPADCAQDPRAREAVRLAVNETFILR